MLGSARAEALGYLAVKLFSKNSNLCSRYLIVTDGQTDDLLSHHRASIAVMTFATVIATINCIDVVLILNINEMSLLYRLATVWSQKSSYQRAAMTTLSTPSSTNMRIQ